MSAQLNVGAGYPPTSTYSDQDKRTPEVSREMERLTHQCEVMDKNLAELGSKLLSVLSSPKSVDVGSDKSVPEPVRVPLAQAVYERAQHLTRLNEQVISIIDRIEV